MALDKSVASALLFITVWLCNGHTVMSLAGSWSCRYLNGTSGPQGFFDSDSIWFQLFKAPQYNLPNGYGLVYPKNLSCTFKYQLSSLLAESPYSIWIQFLSFNTQGPSPGGICSQPQNLTNDVFTIKHDGTETALCGGIPDYSYSGVVVTSSDHITATFRSNRFRPNLANEKGFSGFFYANPAPANSKRRRRSTASQNVTGKGRLYAAQQRLRKYRKYKNLVILNAGDHPEVTDEQYEFAYMVDKMARSPPDSDAHGALCDHSCLGRRMVNFATCCRHWYKNNITPPPCDSDPRGNNGERMQCPHELQHPKRRRKKKFMKFFDLFEGKPIDIFR